MDQMIRNPHLTPSLQIQQSGQAESFVFWKRRMFQLVRRRRRRRMGWDGNRQAVQNMLDAIFGVQLSGHLRFSHEWRCVRCYSEDHYTQLLWSRASFHQTVDCRAQHSPLPTDLNLAASLCRFSKRWCLQVGRFLTKIESVARPNMVEFGAAAALTIFPGPASLLGWSEAGHQDLLRGSHQTEAAC